MGLYQLCVWLLIASLCLGLPASQASIRFDAAGDLLSRSTSMPAFGNLTRMLWIYRVTDVAAQDESAFTIADSGSFTAYMNTYIPQSTSALMANTDGLGASTAHGGNTTMGTGTWVHIAMVFDDTANSYSLYVNGTLDSSTTVTGMTGTTTWGWEPIGDLNTGGSSRMDGRVAGYKQYTAVLTAAEIQAEMAYFVPVKRASLHSYSPFRTATETASYVGGATWTVDGTLGTEADPPLKGGVSPGNAFFGF